MNDYASKKQFLTLSDRSELSINTVQNIASFNDDFLEINTELGLMCVEGQNLTIEELINDTGRILIKGKIDGIFYKRERNKKKSGLLK